MQIFYNNPEYNEQRKNVVPLTLEENYLAVNAINALLALTIQHKEMSGYESGVEMIQRLIWSHENMEHAIQTIPKWVSVEKALPEVNKDLLLWDGYVRTRAFLGKDFIFYTSLNKEIIKATHWMPLPKPPEKP